MRVAGYVLIVLGALALGVWGFGLSTHAQAGGDDAPAGAVEKAAWVPPVVGGIAVVSGLLLLATDLRRD